MIPRNPPTLQIPDWQIEINQSIREPGALIELLDLGKELLPRALRAHQQFPLRVTRSYLGRIRKGDLDDPLLKQILPLNYELEHSADYLRDPVGDNLAEKIPGLIHKYKGRVLLTLTGACAIHCRYCFRRHFDYQASNPGRKHWDSILDYIRQDTSIKEVIFSGGDPLSLSDARLAELVRDLEQIEHLRFLRIHTRQPVIVPSRVNCDLIQWLTTTRLKINIVLHINHPQEIDTQVEKAIQILKSHQIDLLNQSVLLKGVNDNPETLIDLSQTLGALGIIPYYLHLLDKVQGARHFDCDENTGRAIIEEMKYNLPGFLVPRLVKEVSGEGSKQTVY